MMEHIHDSGLFGVEEEDYIYLPELYDTVVSSINTIFLFFAHI